MSFYVALFLFILNPDTFTFLIPMCRALVFLTILLPQFMLVIVLTTLGILSPKNFIFLEWILRLLLGYWIGSLVLDLKRRNSYYLWQEERISKNTNWRHWVWEYTKFFPNSKFFVRVRDQMEPHWREEQLLSLSPKVDIAILAMRAFPLLYASAGTKPLYLNVIVLFA